MWYMPIIEWDVVPDWVLRHAIRWLVRNNITTFERTSVAERHARKLALIDKFRHSPIAIHTDVANTQHDELPVDFSGWCWGSISSTALATGRMGWTRSTQRKTPC